MSSSHLDVRHVARLARIALSEEEVVAFEDQLGRVLGYIEHLKKLDVSDVEPTAHTSPIFNVTREDVPGASLPRGAALAIAPRVANNLILVPKVVE
ncbi:MAG TPA: Asp-tRNA(Asn)/Glu-tRNA(Gln) amidotransferase subunit GatC [Terrimicrobiaceae bacterium]|jgi:aspartyl-tRNA(Asn)/glutamyl-tRNA(Gln) amidotransferase subunit C|nr:Asp-tRNA(Asn)/Glu-tRNA(Gln) amidotransferase subunit GatC [Terrimicrobiaceae bacterium]